MSDVVLTVNGGSSSIKFAAYEPADEPRRLFGGQVERLGLPGVKLTVHGDGPDVEQPVDGDAVDHLSGFLTQRLGDRTRRGPSATAWSTGGLHVHDHAVVTPPLLDQLRQSRAAGPGAPAAGRSS